MVPLAPQPTAPVRDLNCRKICPLRGLEFFGERGTLNSQTEAFIVGILTFLFNRLGDLNAPAVAPRCTRGSVGSQIVRPASERQGRTNCLGNPPGMPHPGMLAGHHTPACVIEQNRTHVNSGIKRSILSERAESRVQFPVPTRRYRLARGPSVKCRGAMLCNHEREPLAVLGLARTILQRSSGRQG